MGNKAAIVGLIALAGLVGYAAGRSWSPSPSQHAMSGHAQGHAAAPAAAAADASESFVCPMHPEIATDAPGECPICMMDLVQRRGPVENESSSGFPAVTIEPTVVHNMGVRTALAEVGDMYRVVETVGKITRVDPMARRVLTPPVDGELVYIAERYAGDSIRAGELLFSVLSDELVNLETRFQTASQAGDQAEASRLIPLLTSAGIAPDQIAKLQSGAKPELPAQVHAFEDGFVYIRRGRVGERVHSGFTVFNVGGNYRVIEVTAEIFERQWSWVEEGQDASMTVRGLPGLVFKGSVVRVEPPVGYTTRSLELALKFKTDHPGLSQSMFAHVQIMGQPRRNVLMVPRDAVIRTGSGERVVIARGDGTYQPVTVVAGEEAGGVVEIISGLNAGQQIVASGQFLIDSESQLLSGLRRMGSREAKPVPPMEHPHSADAKPAMEHSKHMNAPHGAESSAH